MKGFSINGPAEESMPPRMKDNNALDGIPFGGHLLNILGHDLGPGTKVKRIFGQNAGADSYFNPDEVYVINEVRYIDGLRRVCFGPHPVVGYGVVGDPSQPGATWDADLFEVVT